MAIVVHAVVFVRVEELDVRVGRIVLRRMARHLVLEVLRAAHHAVRMIHRRDDEVLLLLKRNTSAVLLGMTRQAGMMVRHEIRRAVDVIAVHLKRTKKKKFPFVKYKFREPKA